MGRRGMDASGLWGNPISLSHSCPLLLTGGFPRLTTHQRRLCARVSTVCTSPSPTACLTSPSHTHRPACGRRWSYGTWRAPTIEPSPAAAHIRARVDLPAFPGLPAGVLLPHQPLLPTQDLSARIPVCATARVSPATMPPHGGPREAKEPRQTLSLARYVTRSPRRWAAAPTVVLWRVAPACSRWRPGHGRATPKGHRRSQFECVLCVRVRYGAYTVCLYSPHGTPFS